MVRAPLFFSKKLKTFPSYFWKWISKRSPIRVWGHIWHKFPCSIVHLPELEISVWNWFGPRTDRAPPSHRHTMPFEAYFAPGSDPEIRVAPTSGELVPAGTEGTLVKVTYRPSLYGKVHRAKLVIQVSSTGYTGLPNRSYGWAEFKFVCCCFSEQFHRISFVFSFSSNSL